jgi:1-deoxy-D-xylulose-5-phosphate reductoisomerase
MKKLAILGSTGSIGINVLEVVALHPEKFQVIALAGGGNVTRMEEQILRFSPKLASVMDAESAKLLEARAPRKTTRIRSGLEGLKAVACHPDVEMVVCALSGSVGLIPTLAALQAQKNLALANKEALVMAGEILVHETQERGLRIYPSIASIARSSRLWPGIARRMSDESSSRPRVALFFKPPWKSLPKSPPSRP